MKRSIQQTIIILGMQRSGTSCLAGILEKAGINLGEVSTYNLFNKKGNRENIRIMKLHDELLRYNNGSWDNPPARVEWPQHLKKKRDRIIKGYRSFDIWGFKDPRTLLTLDGWLEVLPKFSFVATFRHPFLVAQSLYARDNTPHIKSYDLWKSYNEKLLFYYKKYKFPVISFDESKEDYKNKVKKLLRKLDINNKNVAVEFYNPQLKHYKTISDVDIPREIMDIYEKIKIIAL